MNTKKPPAARRPGRTLAHVLVDGALSQSTALPPIVGTGLAAASAASHLALWAQGIERGPGPLRRAPPRFTKEQDGAARAWRVVLELARQDIPIDGIGVFSETRDRRWSFLAFERERTVVILDKKQAPSTREQNGEAAAERQWIGEGRRVYHVPAEECDTPARLRFLARYLAIVLGRARLPWEHDPEIKQARADEAARREGAHSRDAERVTHPDGLPPRDHSECSWPPDSVCTWYHWFPRRDGRPARTPKQIERDRQREIEYEQLLEARLTPEERARQAEERERAMAYWADLVAEKRARVAEEQARIAEEQEAERRAFWAPAARVDRWRARRPDPHRLAHPAYRIDAKAYHAAIAIVLAAPTPEEACSLYDREDGPAWEAFNAAWLAEELLTPASLRYRLYPRLDSDDYAQWYQRVYESESEEVRARMTPPMSAADAAAQRSALRSMEAAHLARLRAEEADLAARLATVSAAIRGASHGASANDATAAR